MEKIKTLSIDLETFSDVDLAKCGVYKYAESPNFEILLFGVSVNGGEVVVYDFAQGEKIPDEILAALTDSSVIKWAFNATFERVCLSKYLGLPAGEYFDPQSWRCSMIWAAYMGLPLSLAGVGAVLGLPEQKLKEGKELIKYFCVPCAPTKANGGRTRNLPEHVPEKWAQFKAYNKRDVEVEMAIQDKLRKFPVPDFVWEEYTLDQQINDRGIALDMAVVENAILFNERSKTLLSAKMQSLTSLDNPNSVQQMKQWLSENGLEVDSLGKKEVSTMLKTAPPQLAEVLELRQQLAKSSVKKYQAMKNAVCSDSRTHGMFQFYGANRSGRWAGRLIQLQNLPQNHIPDLEQARALVKSGNYAALELLYDDIPDTLSQLIRTAFVPKAGMKFVVSDFSAIEARVLSWLAGEKWRLDTFKSGKDIYCASASQMFRVPVEKHGVNGHLRQKGKISELACGYGGSVGALKNMGAVEMGVPEDELQGLINDWRNANPHIVKLWTEVGNTAMKAIKEKTIVSLGKLVFMYERGILFIRLPSGRRLSYIKPRIGTNRFGGDSITYMGVGASKKWERLETFGGKLVENIVQAIARDLLASAMMNVANAGYNIVFHVHDEIIAEAPDGQGSVDEMCMLMSINPDWADGIPLSADGYECEYYRKD